jgi:hypothetical protein
LNTKNLPDLRAKVPVFVNLAFNVNIEYLSLGRMNMRNDTLSTLRRVLSAIGASNHLHHMALCMDPPSDNEDMVDWAAWDKVYSVLAEPRFQFLQVLCINIQLGTTIHNTDTVVELSLNMIAAHPSLATRGVKVDTSYDPNIDQCIFCSDNPWH